MIETCNIEIDLKYDIWRFCEDEKKQMLEIKEQSCRVLFKDYYSRDIIMQIHFCGTLWHLMSHFSAKQSFWTDFRDEKWQFRDKDESWWSQASAAGSLDAQRWRKKRTNKGTDCLRRIAMTNPAKEG